MQPGRRKPVRCKQIRNVLASIVQCWNKQASNVQFFFNTLFEMVITVAVLVVNSVLGLEQELAVTHPVSSENSSTRNILIHLCR